MKCARCGKEPKEGTAAEIGEATVCSPCIASYYAEMRLGPIFLNTAPWRKSTPEKKRIQRSGGRAEEPQPS